ncbi:hypothetical protein ACWF2L_03205 [Streptomyces anulatus]
MPIEPLPCDDGGGSTPVEITTCCAPSIASTPLCRADGTTILAVVRSGCVECGETPEDPAAVGWLDVAGVFTPGALPADIGPCEAGCVDTVCRQLCDDADGDGQADTTYSELWCIRADGSAELVLTYRDDPSTPYVPLAPVDCTYGCPESETVLLCDDVGPFLRRYTFLNGTAVYEDVALDGQTPHVVTGTVGVCAGDTTGTGCAEETTPTATLGLCLADGTPIAVLITRDCDGLITQDGWLNLTTGTFSAGAPPAGAQACGDSRAFELAGLLCDVDPGTGDVFAPVLVEYEYNADGSLSSVRLIDPGTGTTYVLQGELQLCPGGTAAVTSDLDLTVLCDVQADGTAIPFLRDYRRTPATGLISGFTDYGLDGTAYAVTGTVGQCSPEVEPCRNTNLLLLCDLDPECQAGGAPSAEPEPNPAQFNNWSPGSTPSTWCLLETAGEGAAVWPGGSATLGPDPTCPGGQAEVLRTIGVRLTAGSTAATEPVPVTVSLRVTNNGPNPGRGGDGRFGLWDATTGTRLTYTAVASSAPVGHVQTLTLTANVPAAALAAGDIVAVLDLETFHGAGPKGWTVDQFAWSADVPAAECEAQFLRTIVKDCATGETVAVVDTTLDGEPYEVQGDVVQCTPPGGGTTPPTAPPCDVQNVIQACRCDDTDGDGLADTDYVELLGVDCDGALTPLGTYLPDLSAPYAPVAPVDCSEINEGAEPVIGVQARRVELTGGQSWDAAAWPTLQSVTAIAHGGTGTVVTGDGLSTLHSGEAATWSVARDTDAMLTGPLTITADTGTVTLSYTIGVTL